VAMVGSVCVSNGDNPSALVGQWVSMSDGKSVELFKDGTGVIDNKNISWKTEGKRFVLSEGSTSRVGDYNLSGYEIKRTFENGEVFVWVKKDKLEDYKKKEQERIRKEAEQRIEKVSSYFTDSRNGQKYRAVKIGNQVWMAQNLNYQTGNSWCYDNNNTNCEKYGRLYDWNTAIKACPSGWHLPSSEEWNGLVTAVGGKDVAGKMLKSTSGWDNNGNGFDGNGFSALPGGYRDTDGSFYGVGKYGRWWTATERGSGIVYYRTMGYGEDYVTEDGRDEGYGLSVRCVME